MRTILTVSIFLSVLLSWAIQANAATSTWADLGGGKARLVADYNPISEEMKAAIEVKLDEGWATYWRYPGGTGIPPIFDFSGSKNISFGTVEFPTPSLQTSGDARYAGYKKTVVFPIRANVSAGQLPKLNVDMLIGVCEEICIPAKANLTINSDALLQSDPVAKRVLSFAKLHMPKPKTRSEVSLDVTRLNEKTLEISLQAPTNESDKKHLFVEGPQEWYLTPAEYKQESDGKSVFHLDLTHLPKDTKVSADQLQFTFVSGSKGFEIQD